MDKIELDVRYYDVTLSKSGQNYIKWPLKDNINFAEELTFDILDKLGVGPVYRYLFALRYVNEEVWLAPDQDIRFQSKYTSLDRTHQEPEESKKRKRKPIQDRLYVSKETVTNRCKYDSKLFDDKPIFELRMRFKPTFLGRLTDQDPAAMNLIYSQLRYDFIHTQFIHDDAIQISHSVLVLIFYDMIRYSIDNSIDFNNLLNQIDVKQFIPKTCGSWVIPLLCSQAILMKTKIDGTISNNDSREHKRKFIEMLLGSVWKDYNSEIYDGRLINGSSNTKSVRVRSRLIMEKMPDCIIDYAVTQFGPQKKYTNWEKVCDIDNVSYGSVDGNRVDIDRTNHAMLSFELRSELDAKSFLSMIHGYYRLMKKWNMDITRNLTSPSLKTLLDKQIHGPIGFNLVERKLLQHRLPGYYLVRQCILFIDRFYIDILISKGTVCSVCIKKDMETGTYSSLSHEYCPKNRGYTLVMKEGIYDSIEKILEDIQIKIRDTGCDVQPLIRVRPNERDNCFSLLLCMSPVKLVEITSQDLNQNSQLLDLPKIIPMDKITFNNGTSRSSNNKMIVRSGILKYSDKNIVYKFPEVLANPTERPNLRFKNSIQNYHKIRREAIFISTKLNSDQVPLLRFVQIEQNRILDWLFVKHPLFAECIGVELSRCAVIQEFFANDRRLDLQLNSFPVRSSMPVDFSNDAPQQLAEALEYLETKGIHHGKIRCHNIYIKTFDPFRISITDPLGTFDYHIDRAFIPPEMMITENPGFTEGIHQIFPNRLRPGFDIWAFATTLWQIYSWGKRPKAGLYAAYLLKPDSCCEKMWSLMQNCWHPDPNRRPTALSICRDMRGIFANFYDSALEQVYVFPDETRTPTQEELMIIVDNGVGSLPPSKNPKDTYIDMKINSRTTTIPSNCIQRQNGHTDNDIRLESQKNINNKQEHKQQDYIIKNGTTDQTKKPIMKFLNKIIQWNNNSSSSINYSNEEYNHNELGGYDNLSRGSSTVSNSENTGITHISDRMSSTNTNCNSHSPAIDEGSCSDLVYNNTPSIPKDDLIEAENLIIESEIGRGSSGVVRRAKLIVANKTHLVAVKFVLSPTNDQYHKLVEDLRTEHRILKDLNHENIVKVFGITNDRVVKMVVEYLPLGSLLSFIRNSVNLYTQLPLKRYAQDIAKGMAYLESNKIIHRDLALRNVLMKSSNQVKICDFGLAHPLDDDKDYYRIESLDRAIPWKWCPPETYTSFIFTLKSDVWSYGIVLWEIYSGGLNPQYPGTIKELPSLFERGQRLEKPRNCPQETYDLMMRCWAFKHEDRPSFSEICADIALQLRDQNKSNNEKQQPFVSPNHCCTANDNNQDHSQ